MLTQPNPELKPSSVLIGSLFENQYKFCRQLKENSQFAWKGPA